MEKRCQNRLCAPCLVVKQAEGYVGFIEFTSCHSTSGMPEVAHATAEKDTKITISESIKNTRER